MDVYTEVKGSIGSNAETLWSQSQEIFQRWKAIRAGTEVPLSRALAILDPKHLDVDEEEDYDAEAGSAGNVELINVVSLLEKVPGMQKEQAEGILLAALELQENDSRDSQSLTDATLRIQHIDKRMKHVQLTLDHVCHMLEMEASLVLTASEGNRAAARTTGGDGSRFNVVNMLGKLAGMFQEHSE